MLKGEGGGWEPASLHPVHPWEYNWVLANCQGSLTKCSEGGPASLHPRSPPGVQLGTGELSRKLDKMLRGGRTCNTLASQPGGGYQYSFVLHVKGLGKLLLDEPLDTSAALFSNKLPQQNSRHSSNLVCCLLFLEFEAFEAAAKSLHGKFLMGYVTSEIAETL